MISIQNLLNNDPVSDNATQKTTPTQQRAGSSRDSGPNGISDEASCLPVKHPPGQLQIDSFAGASDSTGLCGPQTVTTGTFIAPYIMRPQRVPFLVSDYQDVLYGQQRLPPIDSVLHVSPSPRGASLQQPWNANVTPVAAPLLTPVLQETLTFPAQAPNALAAPPIPSGDRNRGRPKRAKRTAKGLQDGMTGSTVESRPMSYLITGERVPEGTKGAMTKSRYYNSRPVDPATGLAPTAEMKGESIPISKFRSQELWDPNTKKRIKPGTPGGVPWSSLRSRVAKKKGGKSH